MSTIRHDPSRDRLALTAAVEELLGRPLLLVPASVRPPAYTLWVCNRHLKDFESSLPITALLSVWIDRYRLAETDAVEILDDMISPAATAKYRFTSDLTTDLAERVEAKLKQRRQEEREEAARRERERRRKAAESEQRATPEEVQALRDRMCGIGRMPTSNP